MIVFQLSKLLRGFVQKTVPRPHVKGGEVGVRPKLLESKAFFEFWICVLPSQRFLRLSSFFTDYFHSLQTYIDYLSGLLETASRNFLWLILCFGLKNRQDRSILKTLSSRLVRLLGAGFFFNSCHQRARPNEIYLSDGSRLCLRWRWFPSFRAFNFFFKRLIATHFKNVFSQWRHRRHDKFQL